MAPPRGPRGWYTFQGINFGKAPGDFITVFAGDDPPMVTDGYAQWQAVNRPLARAVTVFQGYNPTTIQLALRFMRFKNGAWDQSFAAGSAIEGDIATMGWMAGEKFIDGPAPIVRVNCFGPLGINDLIPQRFQGNNMAFVIQTLTWANVAYKNVHGDRIWQEATVVLLQFLPSYQTAPRENVNQRGGWIIAGQKGVQSNAMEIINSSGNPALGLAARDQAAMDIVTDANNTHIFGTRGSITQTIKPGTRVWVPARMI